MLINLNISNFAVFEKESVNFEKGFNVFTGETGAGKSILVEALLLILGERASKNLIRKGKKSAFIEAVFEVSQNDLLNKLLAEHSLQTENDDFLIISREILENGKTINKINNRIVPLSIIKEIGNYLIDIYGQFGHADLFKKENHLKLLDSLVIEKLNPLLLDYRDLLKLYKKKCEEIVYYENKLMNKDSKLEQLEYELNEIEQADIKEYEEEDLLKEIKKLSNIQEIKSTLFEAQNLLKTDDDSSINNLNKVYGLLNKVKSYDENINLFLPELELLLEGVQDFLYDVIHYLDNIDVNEERLLYIENRVSLINRLKRKYGFSIEKILEYKNNLRDEIEILNQSESNLNMLIKGKKEIYTHLDDYCKKITQIRIDAGKYLEKEILKELHDLNMKNIKFKVKISKKDELSLDGVDDLEFLISTNVGSDLNSVQKVVSGGEASRIMLAFKKIGSDIDGVKTLVFDEIDSGISGKTAQMSGIKMNFISDKHQVVCITHSPQIASISKNHFLIEKKVVDNNTFSFVNKLNNNTKIEEIARLLSGLNITDKSLDNAEELIKFSCNI